jgi:hypothetical protein
MKKMIGSFLVLLLLTILSGFSYAADTSSQNEGESFVGVIISMDDGIYLDDGSQLFLLVGLDDEQYSGLTVEVVGESVVVDGSQAIKVKEINVLDSQPQEEAVPEDEPESTTNDADINS